MRHEPGRGRIEDACYATEATANLPASKWARTFQPNGGNQYEIEIRGIRLQERLVRLERGNVGDCKSIGEGIFESRFHFGAGYRIYFGIVGNTIVLLLCGGDKSSQTRDIERAKTYWQKLQGDLTMRKMRNYRDYLIEGAF